jgi:ABC-type Fe3+/spermidine/putrescine transport system ATPase subunit
VGPTPVPALVGFDLATAEGSFVTLLGPSGIKPEA